MEPVHRFPSGPAWKLTLASAPAASPVVDGGRLFVALRSGVVLARKLADGGALWSVDLLAVRPIAASDGIVVIPAPAGIHAVAAESGRPLWSIPGLEVNGALLLRGGWLVIASGERVVAFRAADGAEVWSREVGRVEQRPAVEGSTLYAATADGRVLALDIESGSVRWERTVGNDPSEPFAFDGRLYVGVGGRDFVCLRGDTGEEDWRFQIGAAVRGAATADAAHVYLASMDNLIRALHRTNGAVRWKRDLGYRPSEGPLLVGGHAVAGGMTRVLRGFVANTGAPAGELTLEDDAVTAPAAALDEESRPMLVVATGNLRNEWTLIATVEPAPSIGIAPLAELPGVLLPAPTLPPAGPGS